MLVLKTGLENAYKAVDVFVKLTLNSEKQKSNQGINHQLITKREKNKEGGVEYA